MIAAALVLGNPTFLIPISVVGGVQGVIASLQKKKEIPLVISIFFWNTVVCFLSIAPPPTGRSMAEPRSGEKGRLVKSVKNVVAPIHTTKSVKSRPMAARQPN